MLYNTVWFDCYEAFALELATLGSVTRWSNWHRNGWQWFGRRTSQIDPASLVLGYLQWCQWAYFWLWQVVAVHRIIDYMKYGTCCRIMNLYKKTFVIYFIGDKA